MHASGLTHSPEKDTGNKAHGTHLNDEVADNTAVPNVHARAKRVEDAHHTDLNALL